MRRAGPRGLTATVGRLTGRLTVAVPLMLVLAAPPAAAQHDHTITVPVNIGPLSLRIALLYAVPAVAGFALLRGFLGAPSRRTTTFVCVSAAVGVVLELMLAGRLDVPNQVAVLAFALAAFAAFHAVAPVSRGLAPTVRRVTPFVVVAGALGAGWEFARAWTGAGVPALHSGVIIGLAALAWLPYLPTPTRATRLTLLPLAALLAIALLGATTQATTAAAF